MRAWNCGPYRVHTITRENRGSMHFDSSTAHLVATHLILDVSPVAGDPSSSVIMWEDAAGFDLTCQRVSQAPDLPSNLQQTLTDNLGRWQQKLAQPGAFDGNSCRPVRFQKTSTGVLLDWAGLKYSSSRALRDTVQAEWKAGRAINPFLASGDILGLAFGLQVAVISDEGLLIVARRSSKVSMQPDSWVPTFSEGFEPSDLESGSVTSAIARLLREELGIEGSEKVASCCRNVILAFYQLNLTWFLVAVADFRRMGARFSAKALIAQARAADDSWENDWITAIEPTKTAFDELLVTHQGKGAWGAAFEITAIERTTNVRPA
jgi:hypothetical protein